MSLMSKLLITILALSSIALADESDVEAFLEKGIGSNPSIKSLDINVVETMDMEKPKGWKAYIIQMTGTAKGRDGKLQDISQRSVYFAGDGVITSDLYNINTGKKISMSPNFNPKFYDRGHHLFGNKNAAHKVVIFSDPLCPFCKTFVPKALKYMKKYPKTFDVYYFHFPLIRLHPAAVTLVEAAIVAEMQGRRNVVENLYTVKIGGREKDRQKILDAFNKAQNTKIKLSDITDNKQVQEHFKYDLDVAEQHIVTGTPTMFLDGKKDAHKTLYKKVKIVD